MVSRCTRNHRDARKGAKPVRRRARTHAPGHSPHPEIKMDDVRLERLALISVSLFLLVSHAAPVLAQRESGETAAMQASGGAATAAPPLVTADSLLPDADYR